MDGMKRAHEILGRDVTLVFAHLDHPVGISVNRVEMSNWANSLVESFKFNGEMEQVEDSIIIFD